MQNKKELLAKGILAVGGFAICNQLGVDDIIHHTSVLLAAELSSYIASNSIKQFFSPEHKKLNHDIQEAIRKSVVKTLEELKGQYHKEEEQFNRYLLEELVNHCNEPAFNYEVDQQDTSSYILTTDKTGFIETLWNSWVENFNIAEPQYSANFVINLKEQLLSRPYDFYIEELKSNTRVKDAHNIIFQREVINELKELRVEQSRIKDILEVVSTKIPSLNPEPNLIDFLNNENAFVFGIEYLSEPDYLVTKGKKQYRDYIRNDNLRYVSRSDFAIQNKETGNNTFLIEEEIFEKLNENKGILIYGEGGIGKTRLMLELGYAAKYQGYIVVSIKKHVSDISAINELVNCHLSKLSQFKLLLLFDYIEEHDLFHNIIDELYYSNNKSAGRIKFIANCRKTYDWEYGDTKLKEIVFALNIGIENLIEKKYKDYVIEKIIEPIHVTEFWHEREKFYEARPAFAVFVRYLHENYKKNTQLTDSDVKFDSWLTGRLALTFDIDRINHIDSLFARKEIFHLFSIMPAYDTISDQIDYKFQEEINQLVKDGWFEQANIGSQKVVRVVQDTITDQLLIVYLLKNKPTIEVTFRKLFEFSLQFQTIKSLLISIDRISDHDIIRGNKSKLNNVIRKLIEENWLTVLTSSEYFFFCEKLSSSKILDEENRIEIFSKYSDFFRGFISKPDFGLSLSFAMNYYSKPNMQTSVGKIKSLIDNLLFQLWLPANENFIANEFIGARVISTYCKFYRTPEFPGAKLEQYIALHPFQSHLSPLNGSFIISAFLNNGGNRELIKETVLNWLDAFTETPSAAFVIRAWANSKGEFEFVRSAIQKWLRTLNETPDSAYVIHAWLICDGEKEIIKEYMLKWLELFGETELAERVLSAWLNGNGECEVVQSATLKWLKVFAKTENSRFIIHHWITNEGSPLVIKPAILEWLRHFDTTEDAGDLILSWLIHEQSGDVITQSILNWLNTFGETEKAGYIIGNWLDSKGNKVVIKPILINWLNSWGRSEKAAGIIGNWLKNGGELNDVEQTTLNWLHIYAETESASFIISQWLKNTGNLKRIKIYVMKWLGIFGQTESAGHLLRYWLKCGGSKEYIRPIMTAWLGLFTETENARLLIGAWLQTGGKKEDIISALLVWLKAFLNSEEASYIIAGWLNNGGDKEVIKPLMTEWLFIFADADNANFVIEPWLNNGGPVKEVSNTALKWLDIFCEKNIGAQFVLNAWLRAGDDVITLRPYMLRWLTVFGKTESAAFVIGPWLKCGGENAYVETVMQEWLAEFAEKEAAAFIIGPWLNNRGEKTQVLTATLKWLKAFSEKKEMAQFIFNAWIRNGGDKSIITNHLIKWLQKFGEHDWAYAIYISWLCAGGDLSIIKPYLDNWIKKNENHKAEEVGRLIELQHSSNVVLNNCKDFVISFQKKSDPSEQAKLLSQAVKDFSGYTEVTYITADWLTNNAEHLFAQQVIASVLQYAIDPYMFEIALLKWVTIHYKEESAGVILTCWCEFIKKGCNTTSESLKTKREKIRSSISNWFALNSKGDITTRLNHAWIAIGGESLV